MSYLLNDLSFRDSNCRAESAIDLNDESQVTSSYGTRVDWILLPPMDDSHSCTHPFSVTVSTNEGYQVVHAISPTLSDHNLVMADLVFTLE